MAEKAKILVIDDDPDFVMINRTILESAGYQVDAAQDPDSAWLKIKAWMPDLICLDVMMPTGTEGFHFAHRIRKDAETNHIPILMITSIHDHTDLRFSSEDEDYLPVDDFVEKPIKKETLLQKVETLLAQGHDRSKKHSKDKGIGLKM
ncbi:response regulator [candidate division KSB1 bacterium]|nr:response regulator [candidate division KSB1 bacterium]